VLESVNESGTENKEVIEIDVVKKVQGGGGQAAPEAVEAIGHVTSWMSGTLGKMLGMLFLVIGIALAVVRQSIMMAVPAIAAALMLNTAPEILNSLFAGVNSTSKEVVEKQTVTKSKSVEDLYRTLTASNLSDKVFAPWPTNTLKETRSLMAKLATNEDWQRIQHYVSSVDNSLEKQLSLVQLAVLSGEPEVGRSLLVERDLATLAWENSEQALAYDLKLWGEARSAQALTVVKENAELESVATSLSIALGGLSFMMVSGFAAGAVQRKNWNKATLGLEKLKANPLFKDVPVKEKELVG
jgi:hypothetical protein